MGIPEDVQRRLEQGVGAWSGVERTPSSGAAPEGSVATGRSRIRHRTTHPDARTMRTASEVSFDGATWTAAFEAVYVREEG